LSKRQRADIQNRCRDNVVSILATKGGMALLRARTRRVMKKSKLR
jgi:hypothetical protein